MLRARRTVFALPLLSLFALFGCASADDTTETSSEESELRAPCELGGSCPESIRVLSAKSFDTVPRNDVREDVTVDFGGDPELPAAAFVQATSRKLRFAGQKRVVLTGNAQGTAPIRIDDFILVEVLAESGEVLRVGVVNPTAPVAVDGDAPEELAPMAAWNGASQGWSYDQVDITPLLPEGRTFRLRVSAFDVTSVALVSDVFLKTVDEAAPPPPPPPPTNDDPFDPASCSGTPATVSDFAGRFSPGGTVAYLGNYSVQVRARDCNAVSGCTPWRAHPEAIDMTRQSSDRPPPASDPMNGALMLFVESGKIFPRFVNATCWHKSSGDSTCAAMNLEQPTPAHQSVRRFGWNCWDLTSQPGQLRCGGYTYAPGLRYQSGGGVRPFERILRGWKYGPTGNGESNMPYGRAFVGKSCARVSATLWSSRSPNHSEVEVASLIRY